MGKLLVNTGTVLVISVSYVDRLLVIYNTIIVLPFFYSFIVKLIYFNLHLLASFIVEEFKTTKYK